MKGEINIKLACGGTAWSKEYYSQIRSSMGLNMSPDAVQNGYDAFIDNMEHFYQTLIKKGYDISDGEEE